MHKATQGTQSGRSTKLTQEKMVKGRWTGKVGIPCHAETQKSNRVYENQLACLQHFKRKLIGSMKSRSHITLRQELLSTAFSGDKLSITGTGIVSQERYTAGAIDWPQHISRTERQTHNQLCKQECCSKIESLFLILFHRSALPGSQLRIMAWGQGYVQSFFACDVTFRPDQIHLIQLFWTIGWDWSR